MERTAEYRGCRIDASVSPTTGPQLNAVYQITPLTEEAMVIFGGQWKGVASAGAKTRRDMPKSGSADPLADAMEEILDMAAREIDAIFAATKSGTP
jgi:hypothetical protein